MNFLPDILKKNRFQLLSFKCTILGDKKGEVKIGCIVFWCLERTCDVTVKGDADL